MKELKQLLLEKGIKPTYQRIKILEYLKKYNTHPTVDMIFTALYNKVPTLSKTTVYNTLDVFNKNGLLDVITITGSEQRYDHNVQPHHHFLCKECGAIIDIEVKCPYFNKWTSGEHKIEEVHGYFKGICKDCIKNEEDE
ncbi:transcriptional repressor [candidate division KSB1 bacterium]|nr:transcriptional repressor [candidate division KSB1 bacterium]